MPARGLCSVFSIGQITGHNPGRQAGSTAGGLAGRLTALMYASCPRNFRMMFPVDTSHRNTWRSPPPEANLQPASSGSTRQLLTASSEWSQLLASPNNWPPAPTPLPGSLAVVGDHCCIPDIVAMPTVNLDRDAAVRVPQPHRAILQRGGVQGGGGAGRSVGGAAGWDARAGSRALLLLSARPGMLERRSSTRRAEPSQAGRGRAGGGGRGAPCRRTGSRSPAC